jgi:hypothetical protein
MRFVLAPLLLLVVAFVHLPAQAQQNATVLCSSNNNGYTECRKPYRGPVQLTQKYSEAGCAPGRSWGQTDDVVWVDRGCRALFEMAYPASSGRPPDYGNRPPDYGRPGHGGQVDRELKCESRKDRYQSCEWQRSWGRPELSRQLSQTRCVEGQNWGYSRRDNEIWVDQGCRAEFRSR